MAREPELGDFGGMRTKLPVFEASCRKRPPNFGGQELWLFTGK